MRLFGSKPDEGETAEPLTSEQEVQEEQQEELEDLTAYYDPETGQSLNVNDAGEPVDPEGNPIPELMPGFVAEEVEVPGEPQPHVPIQYVSPFQTDLLTAEEQEQVAENGMTIAMFERMAIRASERTVAAERQQHAAAAELGIDPQEQARLAPRLSKVAQMVPKELRGSREGAMTNYALAALDEAFETGDFQGAMSRLTRTGVMLEQKPAEKQKQMIPASARMPNPRPSAGPSQPRVRGVKDTIAQVFGNDDALAIIQKERRKTYHG